MIHKLKLVYITAPSKDLAMSLGQTLVESRLAACVNILPLMTSMYRWEDKISLSDEVVLLAKTAEHLVEDLVKRVKAIHPYEVPCALVFSVEDSLPEYARWLLSELKQ